MKLILITILTVLFIPALLFAYDFELPLLNDNCPEMAQLQTDDPHQMMLQKRGLNNPHRKGDKKRFEQLRLIKLLELLNLGEEKETEFIPMIRSHRKRHQQLSIELNDMIHQLGIVLHGNSQDEPEILTKIKALKEIEKKIQTESKDFFNKIENILTPAQLGRLYIFKARFGAEVMGKMNDFRKRMGKPGYKHKNKVNQKDSSK